MLFTRDAVQMVGRVLAQKLEQFPDWQHSGLLFFLTEVYEEGKREGSPIVTAGHVRDVALRVGYKEGEEAKELIASKGWMARTLAGVQSRCGRWAQDTFTKATPVSIATHLLREAQEVRQAAEVYAQAPDLSVNRLALGDELADALHLILHLATFAKINLEGEFEKKFAENKRRTWKAPDHEGVVEHVKENN
jgi:NTP pyrophosphatase (non-canonical NTP hydrolase)